MITETMGFRIMRVPGLDEIRIELDGRSPGGVHVVLDEGVGKVRDYEVSELAELAQALIRAVELAQKLEDEIAANADLMLEDR
jgi:hypothetical protein